MNAIRLTKRTVNTIIRQYPGNKSRRLKNGSRTDGKAGKRDARIRRQPESNRAQDSAETNRAGLYSGRHWEKGRESGDIVYFDFHCHHVPDFSSVCRYTVYDVCPVEEDMLYIICCSLDEG